MHEEGQARWDPESDPEYSQRLLPYLARRYFSWLIVGVLVGAVSFAIFALFQPASYGTSASLKISKSSGPGGLLAGVPTLLAGKANAAITDELQIMGSRDLGLPIIAETNLQADIYDPGGPDGALGLLRGVLAPGQVATAREDRYARFTVSDIHVSDEMLKDVDFWISADGQGNWRGYDKSGANNQPADFGDFSFTPHFGSGHRPGDRYHIVIKTNWDAWKDYRSALGLRPATAEGTVVVVAFSNRNPYTAKRVIDLLLDAYLKRNHETVYGNFDNMLKFVDDEFTASTARLSAATDEMRKYQEANKVYSPDAQGQAAAKEIADLNTAQTTNQINLKQTEFVLHLLETRSPEEVYDAIKAPGNAGALEGESDQLAALIQQLKVERQTKTEAHPDIQALQSKIKTAVAQLKQSTQSRLEKLQLSDRQFNQGLDKLVGELAKLPAATGKLALLDAQIQSEIEVQKLLKQQQAQTKISRVGTNSEVRLIDTAPVPSERDSPRLGRSFVLGAIAGLITMILAALATDSSRRGFRSLRELRLQTGLPILGVLPGRLATGRWRPVNGGAPGAARLAAWLLGGRRSLGIVQLGGAQASYDLAWSLAVSRAQGDKPATLVDLDRLCGTLRSVWQLAVAPGLPEVAADAGQFKLAAHKVREGVALLAPGNQPLSPEQFAKAWIALGDHAGIVLCCLPPPAQWQDQAAVLTYLDAVVLSVPQGGVPAAAVALTVSRLRALGVEPLGIVVTNFDPTRDALGSIELGLLAVEPAGDA